MKKRNIIIILAVSLLLTGCLHFNYGVKREGSPIPFKNLYDNDDNEEYEFYSVLYKLSPTKMYGDYVEITHLNDVYNHYQGTPESTWKKSFLSFNLFEESGIELIPDFVTLQHFSNDGELIKPSNVESTLNECKDKIGCRKRLILHYPAGIPKSITEKVSFTLKVKGIEKSISYTIPLEYKYHYSFWDVMMGV